MTTNNERNEIIEQCAAVVDQCNREGPYQAIAAALRSEADWRSRALKAEAKIEEMQAERLKLDKRIHNQRVALRQNWEIVEMRRKWLGSDTARRMYGDLLKRHRKLLAASRS